MKKSEWMIIKAATLALVACLCMVLTAGCGGGNSAGGMDASATHGASASTPVADVPATSNPATNSPTVAEPAIQSESSEPEPSVEPEPEPVADVPEIKWTYITNIYEDSDGYKYEITYKVSPWILLSNTDIVNSAWGEVNMGKPLPEFNDWGLSKDSSNRYGRFNDLGARRTYWNYDITDMYYCVGNVSVKNVTEGWSINSDDPRHVKTALGWAYVGDIPGQSATYIGAYTIGKILGSSVVEEADCAGVSLRMSSDKWGPVPFVIMAPENFSPKYPDGQYHDFLKNGALFWDHDQIVVIGININISDERYIKIGIYGKDGQYFSQLGE